MGDVEGFDSRRDEILVAFGATDSGAHAWTMLGDAWTYANDAGWAGDGEFPLWKYLFRSSASIRKDEQTIFVGPLADSAVTVIFGGPDERYQPEEWYRRGTGIQNLETDFTLERLSPPVLFANAPSARVSSDGRVALHLTDGEPTIAEGLDVEAVFETIRRHASTFAGMPGIPRSRDRSDSIDMRSNTSRLGRRLRQYRHERGLTQRELARQLSSAQRTVSLWERGTARPTRRHLDAIAKVLGIEAGEVEVLALRRDVDESQSEDYWKREEQLLAIGNDATRSLSERRRALGAVIQTEVDPWPPGLVEAYSAILRDSSLPLLERLDLAFSVSAYGDPMENIRGELIHQALALAVLPSKYLLQIASQTGGVWGLETLLRLQSDPDTGIACQATEGLSWLAGRESEAEPVRRAAFVASVGSEVHVGHVFVSYVREDADMVAQLETELHEHGIELWKDTERLRPGDRWRRKISSAIRGGDAFVAVFSTASEQKQRSYMREELLQAVEELRLRPAQRAWFFPVMISECELPRMQIGANEYLSDLQYAPLHRDWSGGVAALAEALLEATVHYS
jgi:transcriptional regulator with XRE-family HTH domain